MFEYIVYYAGEGGVAVKLSVYAPDMKHAMFQTDHLNPIHIVRKNQARMLAGWLQGERNVRD
jgi:hypothetical protein